MIAALGCIVAVVRHYNDVSEIVCQADIVNPNSRVMQSSELRHGETLFDLSTNFQIRGRTNHKRLLPHKQMLFRSGKGVQLRSVILVSALNRNLAYDRNSGS